MLIFAIIASIILIITGLIVPFVSNISTPKNLYKWYFGKQSLALWIAIGMGVALIWIIYIIMVFIN